MDSCKFNLSHFSDIPDMDIMKTAELFYDFMRDVDDRKHYHYRRVSLTGSGPVMRIIDRYTGREVEMINLASNDYLNLTKHPRTIKAGIAAVEKYGTGAGSVPLLGGTLDIHIELEKKVAKFKGCEDAIIFSNGFGSNCGAIRAMLKKSDVAILDMYAHASIIDGCTGTNVELFRHNNMDSLQKVLEKVKNKYRTKLVVVDGVYSMDGDIAKLDEICEIAHSYGAYVMVDEAHATGVIGRNGRGTPEYYSLEGKVDIVAGTFSKALGVVGGFVCGSKELIEYLRYFSRSYMFSTAQTPQTAASLIEAIDVIETEPWLRQRLWENINCMKSNLMSMGFNIGNSETAIFPIIVGDEYKVKEICRELHDIGIYVNPVMYPAVQKRLSRVRMSITSGHTSKHLDKVFEAMDYLGDKYKIKTGIAA